MWLRYVTFRLDALTRDQDGDLFCSSPSFLQKPTHLDLCKPARWAQRFAASRGKTGFVACAMSLGRLDRVGSFLNSVVDDRSLLSGGALAMHQTDSIGSLQKPPLKRGLFPLFVVYVEVTVSI